MKIGKEKKFRIDCSFRIENVDLEFYYVSYNYTLKIFQILRLHKEVQVDLDLTF